MTELKLRRDHSIQWSGASKLANTRMRLLRSSFAVVKTLRNYLSRLLLSGLGLPWTRNAAPQGTVKTQLEWVLLNPSQEAGSSLTEIIEPFFRSVADRRMLWPVLKADTDGTMRYLAISSQDVAIRSAAICPGRLLLLVQFPGD